MNILSGDLQLTAQSIETSLLAIAQSAATTFVTALWQGAVIALCLAVCLKFMPRTSAALRFTLWAAGFALVVGLPFLPVLMAGFSAPAVALSSAHAAKPLIALDLRWSLLISVIWAATSLYRATALALHVVRLRKLWKSAIPVASSFSSFTSSVGLRRPVQLCTTTELDRPAVIGFFAPRILIPEWLITKLTPGELDQIVLHESEHLRRSDDWTNLLQKLSLVLFPLNPVLLWMERRLCLEREIACDDGVVRVTQAPRAYATCLTSLAERGLHHRAEALSLGVLRRRPELVHRVHSLLRRGRVLGPVGSRSLAAAITCAMVFGVVELSRCPQLVAFEITPHTTTNSILAKNNEGSRVKSPDSVVEGQFKVVYAKAVQPGLQPKPANAARRVNAVRSINPKVSAYDRSVLKASAGQQSVEQRNGAVPVVAHVDPAQSSPQNYIVLTTWEQESTPLPGADPSDFSSGVASRTIVTQTIFRVIPAKAVRNKHTGPNSTYLSPEPIPTLIPSRDGWLVLEL